MPSHRHRARASYEKALYKEHDALVVPHYRIYDGKRVHPVTLSQEQWTYRTICDQCKRVAIVRYWIGMRPACEPCGETLYTMQELGKVVGE